MTTIEPGTRRTRPLDSGERAGARVIGILIGMLGLIGFINSFTRVRAAAESWGFGSLSFTVPLGTDVAIAAFSGLDILLARLDMRIKWVRFVPWVLTAATIFLNVSG